MTMVHINLLLGKGNQIKDIPQILVGWGRRIYAGSFSFRAGEMPPPPPQMLGRALSQVQSHCLAGSGASLRLWFMKWSGRRDSRTADPLGRTCPQRHFRSPRAARTARVSALFRACLFVKSAPDEVVSDPSRRHLHLQTKVPEPMPPQRVAHQSSSVPRTLRPARGWQVCAYHEQQTQGHGTERSSCQKRRRGTKTIPKQSRDKACNQQGNAADQIEKTVRSSAQVRRGGIGNHHRQKPLRHAHVQAPDRNADHDNGSMG